MPNRLAQENSPYLLQHAGNPVDWYAWGPEALQRSEREQKPIFLSIGYSACHWCHVMEHESFENAEIAAYLNEHFVCIKVDREERPDLDQIYMTAVQMLTGRGGWPMSVFLTPRQQPFYGGTYWPPHDSRGMPGFTRVLRAVVDAWQNRRSQAQEQADELTQHLRHSEPEAAAEPAGAALLEVATGKLQQAFDHTHGGFGGAPKFPHAMHLQFLLRRWQRQPHEATLGMVRLTLDAMWRGGIYDHVGGGFARYSVDARWLVPHFEKMLYDNALLAGTYLEAYLVTGESEFARVVRETCDYVLRDLADSEGGFHSAEDADSEGEEGKFYVWTPAQLREVLGDNDAERCGYVFGVTAEGNFEHGTSILHLPKTLAQCAALRGWNLAELEADVARWKMQLHAARGHRVRPAKDDKVLADWNALMIDTLARAGAALGEARYVAAATRCAEFVTTHMQNSNGRLWHAWRSGRANFPAYLDDYAALANALVSLYEATFDERWIDKAVNLADLLLAHFHDREHGGFFFTANDHESLVARQKDFHDSSVPSGCALAATALQRLAHLCGRTDFETAARETLDAAAALMERSPLACGQMLCALEMHVGPFHQVVVLGDARQGDTAIALAELRQKFLPHKVVACRPQAELETGSPEIDPIFLGRHSAGAAPAVFVCQNFTCQTPVNGLALARRLWERLAQPGGPEE